MPTVQHYKPKDKDYPRLMSYKTGNQSIFGTTRFYRKAAEDEPWRRMNPEEAATVGGKENWVKSTVTLQDWIDLSYKYPEFKGIEMQIDPIADMDAETLKQAII